MEQWKDIVGFEGLYAVSDLGRVRSLDRDILRRDGSVMHVNGKIMPQYEKYGNSPFPRLQVNLSKGEKRYSKQVSRLVAIAFIPNPNNLPQVNHKDENPLNNNVNNLEWCTSEYNHNYGTRNQRQAEKLQKAVDVYDLQGNYLYHYDSIKLAAQELHCDASCIAKVCKKQNKYHHQYIFRYDA